VSKVAYLLNKYPFSFGFEVLTAVEMKILFFWDITPYSPVKVNRHFGGTNSPYLQGRRVSQARNQREVG
jgi:hypothetical protein